MKITIEKAAGVLNVVVVTKADGSVERSPDLTPYWTNWYVKYWLSQGADFDNKTSKAVNENRAKMELGQNSRTPPLRYPAWEVEPKKSWL